MLYFNTMGFAGVLKLLAFVSHFVRNFNTMEFAESVVTLGEFKMPYKIESLDEILWRYRFDEENALYLCENNK